MLAREATKLARARVPDAATALRESPRWRYSVRWRFSAAAAARAYLQCLRHAGEKHFPAP